MPELTKLAAARAQLLTALDLFIRDKSPIAVHCLACGGGELMEGIAEHRKEEPFVFRLMQQQPTLDRATLRTSRNLYWNAFKHFSDRGGLPRVDQELLDTFDDTKNDAALYIGWWDYLLVTKSLPISAQVFQVWWYAIHPGKVSQDADLSAAESAFPRIANELRVEQKRRLRRKIEVYRKDKRLLSDPATEPE